MKPEEFMSYLYSKTDEDYGIMIPPIEAQDGLNILIEHFLGEDWTPSNTDNEQINSEAIYEILKRYSNVFSKRSLSIFEFIEKRRGQNKGTTD